MSCPMFKDYTRECISKFKEISKVSSYDLCDSENYEECPAYQIEFKKRGQCEFLTNCKADVKINTDDFEKIKEFGNIYCLSSENKIKCARYILYKEGKKVPANLLADGSNS